MGAIKHILVDLDHCATAAKVMPAPTSGCADNNGSNDSKKNDLNDGHLSMLPRSDNVRQYVYLRRYHSNVTKIKNLLFVLCLSYIRLFTCTCVLVH